MLPQIAEAAEAVYQFHHEGGEIPFLAAQSAVDSGTDDLRLDHIRKGGNAGSQNGHQKVTLGAFQKAPQQSDGLLVLHVHSPFLKIWKKGAGGSLHPSKAAKDYTVRKGAILPLWWMVTCINI